MEHPTLKAHAFGQAHFESTVDAFLDHHRNRQRLFSDQRGDFQRFIQQLIARHDTRHDAATFRFHGIDQAAAQAHFHGLGLAHGAGQALGAAHARQHAEVDFRLAESGVVTGQNEIAHQRQLTAAAQGETVDRRDDRLAAVGYAVAVAEQVVDVDLRIGQLRHFLDVGTGGKGFFRTGQDDAADVRVGFEAIEGLVQFADDLRIQRIQRLWTVEGDQANAAVGFQQNRFVVHRGLLLISCAK
ncbi:hypothetical protein D3C80_1353040 [compost metagenome]